MNNINKTLYIPLYGKAYVTEKKLFLDDVKAVEIWSKAGIKLGGKSKSKWLAYYMGIRALVFDNRLRELMQEDKDAVVIHIGCGLDSRILRVGEGGHKWYDVDFPEVISERKYYFTESDSYKMISADVREKTWLDSITEHKSAIVVMEGVSMYMSKDEFSSLFDNLTSHFENLSLIVDCYSSFAAKMSKYKNPINDVGVTKVYGIDDPKELEGSRLTFVKEHDMTPIEHIDQLSGIERRIFSKLYAGSFSKKLYRLYEYTKTN